MLRQSYFCPSGQRCARAQRALGHTTKLSTLRQAQGNASQQPCLIWSYSASTSRTSPSAKIILEELERHRQAHLEKLSTYKVLERRYFQHPQQLTQQAKFQYLTLLNGISYETHWIAWCEQAIQLLS